MGAVRQFGSGATRDADTGKLDYEGFLSPAVLQRFAEYMHKNRVQSDGTLRSADNWQKGIPKSAYASSLWRHFMDWWLLHRGLPARSDQEEALCALIFNAMGYLYEVLRQRPDSEKGIPLCEPSSSTSPARSVGRPTGRSRKT